MRFSHAPAGWACIFCRIAGGGESPQTKRSAVVWHDDETTAFLSSRWWASSPGHVLVIPNRHVENVYEFPDDLGGPFMATTRRVARALKAVYGCDGVSTRQHNEPAGDQDVWHLHQHVFPRWAGDRLYERHAERAPAPAAEVAERAALLRAHLLDAGEP